MTHLDGHGWWRRRDGKTVERNWNLGPGDPVCAPLARVNYSDWRITRDERTIDCPDCLAWIGKFYREQP